MSNRPLIAAAVFALVAGGTVFAIRASSDETSPAPAPPVTRAPATVTPKPALPRPPPPPIDQPPAAADIDTSRATDPVPSQDDRAAREQQRANTGSQQPLRTGEAALKLHARTNPPLANDPTPDAEVREKLNKVRMHSVIDRANCNAPDAKARIEKMSPEDRAKWEKRCAKFKH